MFEMSTLVAVRRRSAERGVVTKKINQITTNENGELDLLSIRAILEEKQKILKVLHDQIIVDLGDKDDDIIKEIESHTTPTLKVKF